MIKPLKKILSVFTSVMMLSALAMAVPQDDKTVYAADSYKFDFGNGGAAWGYTGVSASQGYDRSKGYGFGQTYNMADSSASGSGALSDAVIFKSADKGNTFNVDLPNGLYNITVYLGNATRVSIVAEDVLQLINITGNNGYDSFTIPVTDGQLNIMAVAGKENTIFSMSALEIEKISDDTALPPTIWLCGDSTVCNYYPKDTAQRVGWGQMLGDYVSKDLMIRNLAASGQYAAGFVSAGQFEPVLKYGKPGDYYVISIGINDTNYSNSEEYYNVVTDMTRKAKEKGMTVILVKQQGRAGDITRSPLLTGRWFGSELDRIGSEQNVKVVDLFNLAQNYFLSIGPDQTTALYDTGDTLHFNRSGAKVLAKLVSDDVGFKAGGNEQVEQPPQQNEDPPAQPEDPPQDIPSEPQRPQRPVNEAEGKIYGDFNDDGTADLSDLTMMSQFLLSDIQFTQVQITLGDFDGDEEITVSDLAKLKQYIMKDQVDVIGTVFVSEGSCIYPAVEAKWDQGITETVNAGFECEAYINLDNVMDSSLEWTVSVPKQGNYYTEFRVANGSTNDRSMKVLVNGDTQTYWVQSFPSTGAWTSWEARGLVLPLAAGINTIKAVSLTSEGGPNFDYLRLDPTDEPVAQPYDGSQNNTNNITPSDNPVIYIAGDSTVQSYRESYAPMQGWGYYLKDYFNDNVSVSNHALAGRSSKSFFNDGRLDTILGQIKSGDYLLVQFAINDADYTKEERYAPVCGSVVNPTNGSFEFYINKYVEGAVEKGATPVLVTTTLGLKAYSNGKFVTSYDNYRNAMKSIADHYRIPCIDLNSIMVNHYNSIGYDAAKKYHMAGAVEGSTDMTHFCEYGAKNVAGLVASEIRNQNLPVASYLK